MRARPSSALLVLCPLLVIVAGLVYFQEEPGSPPGGGGSGKPAAAAARAEVPSAPDFREWRKEHTAREMTPELLAEAKAVAAAHKERMLELMQQDPARALEEAMTRGEYAALPEELKPYFEQPFNAMATLRVMPVCHPEAKVDAVRVLEMEGKTWEVATLGKRLGQGTKENAPLTGITLDGRAVVAEATFEMLSKEDSAKLAALPVGQKDRTRDFTTGDAIGEQAVTALAGGKRFFFRDEASLTTANDKLAKLDEAPGPHSGARVIFALPSGGDGGGEGFNWEAAEVFVQEQASSWTEQPKSVFFIRVDFSDKPGEPVSQAALAQVLNTTVSNSIEEMSYNKTAINGTVSPMTVRMPQPSSFYLPTKNSELHTDAKNAYLALAGASALNGYDIVGVFFTSIGIKSGSLTYAGLAGGGNQWIQGTTSASVIIHEFGHNYGLGHSSFWQTSDGSVVGTGTTDEYGDPFDIMGGGSPPAGHFHMQGKALVNWLTTSQWVDVDTAGSGTQRLYRFDHAATTGEKRGLRVRKGTAPDQYYWVGYRGGIEGNAWLKNGAYMVWQRPGEARSWLLDTTPGSAAGREDGALLIGRTYSDATAGVHITPLAVGGSGADAWLDVNVQTGSFPGNLPPVADMAALPGTVAARNSLNLSATASDPNSDTLAYFWNFGDGTPSVNAASTSHAWATGGTYTVTLTVSDMKGGTATDSATITVSDPLDQWTTGTVVASRDLYDVAYLDGRYVAGGKRYMYFSVDGVTWDERDIALNFNSRGLATDNSKFVAVGMDWTGSAWYGTAYHSADGRVWSLATVPMGAELNDVASGGGVFVAVGNGGRILRSTDGGATWTNQTSPGITNLSAVAWGGGVFVAAGDTALYTSPDGVAWTDRSSGTGLESWHSFDDVVYQGGAFYAGGWYSGIKRSTDGGVSWQRMGIVGSHDYDVQSIATGPGVMVASARDKTDNEAVLLVSADGQEWRENSVHSVTENGTLAYGGGRAITVYGNTGNRYSSAAFYPTNQAPTASIGGPSTGSARQSLSFSATTGDADSDPLTLLWDFNDGTALAEGSSANHVFPVGGSFTVKLHAIDKRGGVTTVTKAVTISDPLTQWTQRTSGTTANLRAIAANNDKLVAVGSSNGSYRISTDGTTWTSGGTISNNVNLTGIIWDGAKFVASGYDYDFTAPAGWKGAIYTSPDGTAWTRRHYAGKELRDIAFTTGRYIAVGDAGAMWTSTDGLAWSAGTPGTTRPFNSVAWGGGKFVAVAPDPFNGASQPYNHVFTSPDGMIWTDTSAGTGVAGWQYLERLRYCNDRFLASGWYAKIRHSTDGGSTFSTTESVTRDIAGFAYGNGVYLTAGLDRDNGDADINLLSTDGATWTPLATTAQSNRNAAIFFKNTFVTVGDGGSIWQSAVVPVPVVSGYATWAAAQFPGNPPLSGPNDDYDHDGVPNLGEYKTGSNPKSGAHRTDWNATSAVGFLTITVPKAADTNDVNITVQYSAEMKNDWSSAGVTIVENSATQLVAKIPTTNGKGFVRVVFEQQ